MLPAAVFQLNMVVSLPCATYFHGSDGFINEVLYWVAACTHRKV